jgi:membrane protein YdbS with pleckstrin-like domain
MSKTTYKVDSNQSLLPTLLFVAFVVLKLTKVIAWSWWWVTAPLWPSSALALLIGLVVFVVVVAKK